jgi:hypothetical protein
MNRPNLLLAALLLALFGFWSPWLQHPAAALHLNAFELSEWVTFLPGVRAGALPFGRLSFLVPSACLAVLFGLAAARTSHPAWTRTARLGRWRALLPATGWSWVLLGIGVLCSFAVFPYYPYLVLVARDFFNPDYQEFQLQFVVAGAALAGVFVAVILPGIVKTFMQMTLALIGAGFSAWALWSLQPVASELLNAPWGVGYGWAAILLGFAGVLIAGWRQIFQPRQWRSAD